MKWRKSPQALVRRFSELVPEDPRVSRRQMFGYPCAFVAGHLFMGLHQEAMILRLSEEDRATLLGLGAAVFEPMPGRPMREYVVVPPPLLDRTAALSKWIRRALDYAASRPPKKATRRRKPATRRDTASKRR